MSLRSTFLFISLFPIHSSQIFTFQKGSLSEAARSQTDFHKNVHSFVAGQRFLFSVINSHLDDQDSSYTENITLIITNYDSSIPAHVTVTSPYMNFDNNQFIVAPSSSYRFSLPAEIQTNYRNIETNYIVPSNKSISVISTTSMISVVVRNVHSDGYSEDDYVIYPICTLGSRYHSVGDESIWRGFNSTNIFSIIATQDNTIISTVPRLAPVNFTINAGEVLTFSSNQYPLSNYQILTSAPTAVIAGSVCGFGYYNQDLCNHEAVMLFPLDDSGIEFPFTQFLSGNEGEIMCFASKDRTVVSLNGEPWQYLSSNEYLLLRVVGSVQITFSQPSYAIGIGSMRSDRMGSPFMVHIPATSQFTNQSTIVIETGLVGRTLATHYIRVQTSLQSTGLITVDDWRIDPLYYQRQGKSGIYVADWEISAGSHLVKSDGDSNTRFAITVYGFAPMTAYAYTPGIDLYTIGAC